MVSALLESFAFASTACVDHFTSTVIQGRPLGATATTIKDSASTKP